MRIVRALIAVAVIAPLGVISSLALAQSAQKTKTDAQIRQELIARSIAGYSGSCPCPYNTDRAGRSCGRRSAYSKPGGAAPLCYPADVTAKMVADYRAGNEAKKPAVDTAGSERSR